MLAKVCSAAVNGVEAYPVEVEVNAGYGDTIIVIIMAISPIPTFAFHSSSGFRMLPNANVWDGFDRQPHS
ncbi:MAG: hypothetical protein ABSH34_23805 [Verrucomicrobiota bacterium]|jgi:hypothetical protein